MNEFSTTKEIMQEFAAKLKTERLRQNITQEDIALKAGVSLSTYKIFENSGKGSFENFINITKALGKVSMLNTFFTQSSFSPKENTLNQKTKKYTRQRASGSSSSVKEKEELYKPTRLGSLLDKLKAKNESK